VFDLANWSGSDFYTWSELSAWSAKGLRAGLALQRTHAVGASRNLQWGPLIGFKAGTLTASMYWFNPGQTNTQYWVMSVGANF